MIIVRILTLLYAIPMLYATYVLIESTIQFIVRLFQ